MPSQRRKLPRCLPKTGRSWGTWFHQKSILLLCLCVFNCRCITEFCLLYAFLLFFNFPAFQFLFLFCFLLSDFFFSFYFLPSLSSSILPPRSRSLYLSLPQTEVCLASDILCSKLRAVQRCVDCLLSIGGGEELKEEMKAHSPPLSPFSLVPTGFLLFYCLVMGLLYLLYHHLTA